MGNDRPALGRLERVKLREFWRREDSDFTPWLAEPENIVLLGDAIGLDLEVEATERDVGSFRADILCKETETDHWVLIENQLERTDHSHLGQILTYAAGLNAETIVWVAERFTEEHRAGLDWLNEISGERFNFFGLEIELWKIGDSPPAPKFNIVSKPNDWTQSSRGAAGEFATEGMTATRKLQIDFWTRFGELLRVRDGVLHPKKPQAASWTTYGIGRSGFHLTAVANARDRRIGFRLVINDADAKAYFRLLAEDRLEIERDYGEELIWEERPDRVQSHIQPAWMEEDPSDRSRWPQQQERLIEKMEAFHRVFAHRIKALDASEEPLADDS